MSVDGVLLMQLTTVRDAIESALHTIVEALLSIDVDIVSIILFGSAVYAPELAHDLDLLIISSSPKQSSLYSDAVEEALSRCGCDLGVDVVVVGVEGSVGKLSSSVRAFGEVIYGDERWLMEVTKGMPAISFDDARHAITEADMDRDIATSAEDLRHRDARWRSAFNWLFESARGAVMAYLGTQETRWGQLRRSLPSGLDVEFRDIADTLHVRYWYRGEYPSEPEDAYAHWRERIQRFIEALECERYE